MQERVTHHEHTPRPHRRRRALGALCLRHELTRPDYPRNNDPLAHLYCLHEAADREQAEAQIRTEFVTDLSERSERNHFYAVFSYRYQDGDLISDTGLSLKRLLADGVAAARKDAIPYGIERAEVLAGQLDYLTAWYESGDSRQLGFFSLCPDSAELDRPAMERLAFKPDRQMSSNWIFERCTDGQIRMHAFSLDGHTLAAHQHIVGERVAGTSLEELAVPRFFAEADGAAAVERIRAVHDGDSGSFFGIHGNADNAAVIVSRHPEVYALYRETIGASYEALRLGRITPRLRNITSALVDGYAGFESPVSVLNKRLFSAFDARDAAELIEYLRRQAIPHYLFGGSKVIDSIAESGAAAVSQGLSYEGACPTSAERTSLTQTDVLSTIFFGRLPSRERTFRSRFCPCCLPKPVQGVTVNAWSGQGFIGCDDCGHIVETCGGVYRPGVARRAMRRRQQQAVKSGAKK